MNSPVANPVSPYSRPPFYPQVHELKAYIQSHPIPLNVLSSNLHNSVYVNNILNEIIRAKGVETRSLQNTPPPTPTPDIRAHKRRKSDSDVDEISAARWHLAEDISRIIAEAANLGAVETKRNRYSPVLGSPPPLSNELPPLRIPNSYELPPFKRINIELTRQTSLRPWEEEFSHKRKYSGDDDALRQLSAVAAAQPGIEAKERFETPDDDTTGSGEGSSLHFGKAHQCPYWLRDKTGRTHPKCAGRTFPNPRKLKEHVWQTTRPYKCSTCLFGFGRDKTRAIHVKERKKGCKRPPPGSALLRESYENSPEHIRDQRIEAARTTAEIVEILDEYDKAKGPDAEKMVLDSEYSQDRETLPRLRLPSIGSPPHTWNSQESVSWYKMNRRGGKDDGGGEERREGSGGAHSQGVAEISEFQRRGLGRGSPMAEPWV